MFKKKELVMYKNEVCEVIDIKEDYKNHQSYYILRPMEDKSLVIHVPIENNMGYLRKIISKENALKLIQNIKKIEPLSASEKDLQAIYRKLLYSGKQEDLVQIIKTTYLRNEARTKEKKKKSEKDSEYFEKAEKYLYNELAIALDKSFEETKEFIIRSIEGVS